MNNDFLQASTEAEKALWDIEVHEAEHVVVLEP